MDILRRELNAVYDRQCLGEEVLDVQALSLWRQRVAAMAVTGDEIDVITDASADRCHIFTGRLGALLGIADGPWMETEADSSDEDAVYARMHPEDLVDKRMLEYEYFKFVDPMPGNEKVLYKAVCRIRIMNQEGRYLYVDNSTQVLHPSEGGRIWLILCRYALSANQAQAVGIGPFIVSPAGGEVRPFSFAERRRHLLTEREKEVLRLVSAGRPSKQISDILGISVNTVNRHRQNILEKLSVGNSVEAVTAATAMRLL